MNIYKIKCLSTAISPITHMARTEGNEAVINREPVATPSGIRWLPALSGNALRHKMVREPGARFIVERWGLRGMLTLRQLNFLFHGGTLTESSARSDVAGFAEFYKLFPLGRIIGGSLPSAILPGLLIVGRGVLVCRENVSRVASIVPSDAGVPKNLRSAEAFIEGYQYTRGDAKKSAWLEASDAATADESSLMIFSGQSVIAGAAFAHDLIIQNGGPLELGALLLSLSLWMQSGATIGGQSSRGHGRIDTIFSMDNADSVSDLMGAYVDHVDAMKERGIAWLEKTFNAPKEAPARKGAKKSASPAT